jgi:hypothetical protein
MPIERRYRIIIMKSTAISAAAARKRKSRARREDCEKINKRLDEMRGK